MKTKYFSSNKIQPYLMCRLGQVIEVVVYVYLCKLMFNFLQSIYYDFIYSFIYLLNIVPFYMQMRVIKLSGLNTVTRQEGPSWPD